jgi:hypothetical protein
MRKWLITVALALSMAGGVASVAAAPPTDSCDASQRALEHGLVIAGDRSGQAPGGGVNRGAAQSNEASEHNWCD